MTLIKIKISTFYLKKNRISKGIFYVVFCNIFVERPQAQAAAGLVPASNAIGSLGVINSFEVAFIIWGALMTLAVAALATVVYRRWRRTNSNGITYPQSDSQSTVGSQSSGDLSDFASMMGVDAAISEDGGGGGGSRGGVSNDAYTVEDEGGSQPVRGSNINNSNNTSSVPQVTVKDSSQLPSVHQQSTTHISTGESVSVRL